MPLNTRRYFTSTAQVAKSNPEYWATSVPYATPLNPRPLQPPIPKASTMLARTFIPFTTRSVHIELTVSCIPMNQPLNVIRDRVAGAAQMRM